MNKTLLVALLLSLFLSLTSKILITTGEYNCSFIISRNFDLGLRVLSLCVVLVLVYKDFSQKIEFVFSGILFGAGLSHIWERFNYSCVLDTFNFGYLHFDLADVLINISLAALIFNSLFRSKPHLTS